MPPAAAAVGGRGDGLAVFVARLAERGAHVHQARAEHRAVFLDDGRAVGSAKAGAEIRDHTVAHQQIAQRIHAGRRVEQSDAEEERVGGHVTWPKEMLPLPLREGVRGRGADASTVPGVRTPPPNSLPQGEGEDLSPIHYPLPALSHCARAGQVCRAPPSVPRPPSPLAHGSRCDPDRPPPRCRFPRRGSSVPDA